MTEKKLRCTASPSAIEEMCEMMDAEETFRERLALIEETLKVDAELRALGEPFNDAAKMEVIKRVKERLNL